MLSLSFSLSPFFLSVFPFQRGRQHMPHIPTLGYSHCVVIHLKPYVFYPDKPIEVQITVNHIDTSDKSYTMQQCHGLRTPITIDSPLVSWQQVSMSENRAQTSRLIGWRIRELLSVGWQAKNGYHNGGLERLV